MRLRFAVSGHAPKAEAKEQASESNQTKEPASGTTEPASATNNETKIKAATGN
jgi:two-component system nitrogen regulation sensor histidine kinase NtrY